MAFEILLVRISTRPVKKKWRGRMVEFKEWDKKGLGKAKGKERDGQRGEKNQDAKSDSVTVAVNFSS